MKLLAMVDDRKFPLGGDKRHQENAYEGEYKESTEREMSPDGCHSTFLYSTLRLPTGHIQGFLVLLLARVRAVTVARVDCLLASVCHSI